MNKRYIVIVVVLLLLASLACSGGGGWPTPTPAHSTSKQIGPHIFLLESTPAPHITSDGHCTATLSSATCTQD